MTGGDNQIVVNLAGVPTGKGRPRFARASGRAYTPAKTRSYEENLRYAGQQAMQGKAPLAGPLRVIVTAAFPIPESWSKKKRADAIEGRLHPTTKPDADNLLKVLDAFDQVVWVDDKQIVSATIHKIYRLAPFYSVLVEPF